MAELKSWQCHLCGVVYAPWVRSCESHVEKPEQVPSGLRNNVAVGTLMETIKHVRADSDWTAERTLEPFM